jgi:carbon monoxide dehydrogenase subunit G
MELTNEFEVAVPVETAWAVLIDVERIAPCLPGAQLREVEGDEYRGAVKIKVGPITTSYDGALRFIELDQKGHRAVLKAEGRETRGQGNVSAVITATMSPSGTGTKVTVDTDLSITGKVAQFGRGVLADVSSKLLDQFVTNLEATVLVSEGERSPEGVGPSEGPAPDEVASPAPAAPGPQQDASGDHARSSGVADSPASDEGDSRAGVDATSTSAIRRIESDPVEPVDLLDVAGGSVARRLLKPVAVAGALAFVALGFVRRHRK